MEPIAWVNLLVIVVTCWISILGFRNSRLEQSLVFWPEAVLAGKEYGRLVTSGFLHVNGMHLMVNMITLYLFGTCIEGHFGALYFLLIYFAGIVGGNLLSLCFHRYHDYRACGASGGVCGVIFAAMLLIPGLEISPYFIPIGIPSWLYAILFLGVSYWRHLKGTDLIGHDAHIGGAVVGLLTAAALHPSAVGRNLLVFVIVVAVSVLLFLHSIRDSLHFELPKLRRAPKLRVLPKPPTRLTERDVDRLLEKISQSGIESLKPEEHALLLEMSSKIKRRENTKPSKSDLVL